MKSPEHLSDEELIALLRRARRELPDAPEALQKAAIGLWQPRQAAAKGKSPVAALKAAATDALARLTATLAFDSWAQPALAHGMRAGRSSTRQMLFSTVGRDIDVRIVPGTEGFGIAGQVLGPDEAGEVALAPQGGENDTAVQPMRASLDKLGAFRIDNVPTGTFVLTLNLGDAYVVLPPLEVGECRS